MASSALQALLVVYRQRVDALTDEIAAAEAAWALEMFSGAAECYERAASRGPVSYTLGDRTFAFDSRADAKAAMADARAELDACLSETGGTTRVSFGGTQW